MANTTPQTQPLAGQVANSAGGYVYELDDAQRLARFLVLGSEAGTYYTKPAQNQLENVVALERMVAAGRGVEAVEAIRALSLAGRAPKQTPTLHCLALCARSADAETKAAAYAALSDVCRIPTHLFEFLACAENASGEATGWGRAHRRAVAGWYNGKGTLGLAQAVTKYQQRNGWAHLDALRLCHAKPADAAHAAVFTYVVKGLAAAEEKAAQAEDQGEAEAVLAYLRAVEQMKRCTDAGECAALIVDHRLAREHVPSSLLSSGPVWAALLQGMPLTALTRNLAKMTAVGLIAPGTEAAALVCRRLGDAAALRKARVHPFSVLLAHKTYAAGQGDKGSLTWQPAAEVVAALDKAFQLAFAAVVPAGKRFLLVRSLPPSSHPAATLFHRTPHINTLRFSLAMRILRLRQGPPFMRSTSPARWVARWARATCTAGAARAR